MNRLRHAYIELAPELEPYFVASHHDDPPGIWTTYSFRRRIGMTHWLSGSPIVVGIVNSVVTGVLAAVICEAAGAGDTVRTLVAVATAVATAIVLGFLGLRKVHEVSRTYQARFPS